MYFQKLGTNYIPVQRLQRFGGFSDKLLLSVDFYQHQHSSAEKPRHGFEANRGPK